jgi:hypothetical protein
LALDRGIAERHPVKMCRDEVVFVRPELAATDPHLLLEPAPGEVGPCDSIRTRCVARIGSGSSRSVRFSVACIVAEFHTMRSALLRPVRAGGQGDRIALEVRSSI